MTKTLTQPILSTEGEQQYSPAITMSNGGTLTTGTTTGNQTLGGTTTTTAESQWLKAWNRHAEATPEVVYVDAQFGLPTNYRISAPMLVDVDAKQGMTINGARVLVESDLARVPYDAAYYGAMLGTLVVLVAWYGSAFIIKRARFNRWLAKQPKPEGGPFRSGDTASRGPA